MANLRDIHKLRMTNKDCRYNGLACTNQSLAIAQEDQAIVTNIMKYHKH